MPSLTSTATVLRFSLFDRADAALENLRAHQNTEGSIALDTDQLREDALICNELGLAAFHRNRNKEQMNSCYLNRSGLYATKTDGKLAYPSRFYVDVCQTLEILIRFLHREFAFHGVGHVDTLGHLNTALATIDRIENRFGGDVWSVLETGVVDVSCISSSIAQAIEHEKVQNVASLFAPFSALPGQVVFRQANHYRQLVLPSAWRQNVAAQLKTTPADSNEVRRLWWFEVDQQCEPRIIALTALMYGFLAQDQALLEQTMALLDTANGEAAAWANFVSSMQDSVYGNVFEEITAGFVMANFL